MEDEVEFRPIEPDEIGLVLDSWFKSYRTSDWAGTIPNHLYVPTMREMVGGLVARGAKILAAVVAGRVLGWVCYETSSRNEAVLHFCYVKDPFRRRGLGKTLLAKAIGESPVLLYTHRTRFSKVLLPKSARYVPEIARRKEL